MISRLKRDFIYMLSGMKNRLVWALVKVDARVSFIWRCFSKLLLAPWKYDPLSLKISDLVKKTHAFSSVNGLDTQMFFPMRTYSLSSRLKIDLKRAHLPLGKAHSNLHRMYSIQHHPLSSMLAPKYIATPTLCKPWEHVEVNFSNVCLVEKVYNKNCFVGTHQPARKNPCNLHRGRRTDTTGTTQQGSTFSQLWELVVKPYCWRLLFGWVPFSVCVFCDDDDDVYKGKMDGGRSGCDGR